MKINVTENKGELMEFKIDLNNREKATEQLAEVQKAFDDIMKINTEGQATLKENALVIDKAIISLNQMQNTQGDMVQIIKNVHIMLNARLEMFATDEEIKALITSLGSFIMSSAAVKAGVMREQQK